MQRKASTGSSIPTISSIEDVGKKSTPTRPTIEINTVVFKADCAANVTILLSFILSIAPQVIWYHPNHMNKVPITTNDKLWGAKVSGI